MSKIFKRESLQTKGRKLKVDKNRKRNIMVNFRMSPEEKSLLEEKIVLSGLNKQDYMIQMSINHKVEVFGNIRVFDELKTKLKMLEEYLKMLIWTAILKKISLNFWHIFWKCLKR